MSMSDTVEEFNAPKPSFKPLWYGVVAMLLVVFIHWFGPPVMFAINPNDEQCLPDIQLALLLRDKSPELAKGDMVFWKPQGALHYVKNDLIMKKVGAVAGDRVQVRGGDVYVNGNLLTTGLSLVDKKAAKAEDFDRDYVVQPGSVYVYGTHPQSNDSRYWGPLELRAVMGKGYKLM